MENYKLTTLIFLVLFGFFLGGVGIDTDLAFIGITGIGLILGGIVLTIHKLIFDWNVKFPNKRW